MNNRSYRAVDFHCHLDLFPDHATAIAEAERAEVYTLAVTTTPKAWPRNRDLTRDLKFVKAALGLHPQLVSERSGELALLERFLPETRYIGEVGLDAGSKFYGSFAAQKKVFRAILRGCAQAGNKILSVHSTRCSSVVLDLIEESFPADRGQIVLHWFGGSRGDVRRALSMGCVFSINSEMTKSERGRATVAALPLEALLTESDAPFTGGGGPLARLSDIHRTVSAIATIRHVSPEVIGRQVLKNLSSILRSSSREERARPT